MASTTGSLEDDLDGEPVEEGRQADGELGGVDVVELTGVLAVPDHAGDQLPPLGVELLPHPGHLAMSHRPGPQVQPQGPGVGQLGVGLGKAHHGHDLLEPAGEGLDDLHPSAAEGVPPVLAVPHGLGEQIVLGPEVVDDQGRTETGPLGHAGIGKAPLGDDPGLTSQ